MTILFYFWINGTESYTSSPTTKEHYDIIISINVHEKLNFLLKQLQNIKEHVSCTYVIILNCNAYMFEECTHSKERNKLPDYVYINKDVIEKKRFHGSLVHGIYSNLKYANEHFDFDYFIAISSRNIFNNQMTMGDLNRIVVPATRREELDKNKDTDYTGWQWPTMIHCLLAKYFLERNQDLYVCAHEGLLLTRVGCNHILTFLESNVEIREDLFDVGGCAEEFALQSISFNMGEPFYYVGKEWNNHPDNEIFLHKINRDGLLTKRSFLTFI